MKSEKVRELTVAEISRLTGEYNRRRYEAARELAALFAAAESGQPEERQRTEQAEEARGRALAMLNGYAPAGLKFPPPVSRKADLEIEIQAIDLVLSALSNKELTARADEAAAFAIEHGDTWAELCRDIVLCATTLGALEKRAVEWRARCGAAVPATVPMVQYIGTGRSILDITWAADPLSRPREAALQAGIITEKELKAAQNA